MPGRMANTRKAGFVLHLIGVGLVFYSLHYLGRFLGFLPSWAAGNVMEEE